MLKLTLYKNCILNDGYKNVFCAEKQINENKTVLEKYLDTLLNPLEIELDYVYYENSGEFILDFEFDSSDIYDYNYMKIELFDENSILKLKRYCFIQNISIKNELVYISYKEDIWSSYSNKINGITESYLKRSRVKNYTNLNINLKSIPFNFDGNNALSIESILPLNGTANRKKFKIILEVQTYVLVSSGEKEQKNRKVGYFLLEKDDNVGDQYLFYEEEIYQYISEILRYEQFAYFQQTSPQLESPIERHFEIGDVYIFPQDFNIPKIASHYRIKESNNSQILNDYHYTFHKFNFIENRQIFSKQILGDYKNIAIGTYTTQIPIINNGTNFDIKILFNSIESNIGIFMSVQNQLIDITENFRFDIPYSSLLSEQVSQRKMARELKNLNIDYKKDMAGIEYGKKTNTKIGDTISTWFSPKKSFGQKITRTVENIFGTGLDTAELAITEKYLDEQKALINSPIYSNTNGIFGNSSLFINFTEGLILCKINPDNQDYVKRTINNFGYIVYEYLKDISKIEINNPDYFINNNINYNSIQFEGISIYGSFPRYIAEILNDILNNGVKIWYNENLEDDTYITTENI